METYLASTFAQDWQSYKHTVHRNLTCAEIVNISEYILCEALRCCDGRFVNVLLDLDLAEIHNCIYRSTNSTALMMAANRGNCSIMKKLIDKGASVNGCNSDGTTTIMFAILNSKIEAVQLLIDSGAIIDAQDGYGDTALMWAVNRGYVNIVEVLLNAGADTTIKNKQMENIYDMIRRNNLLVEDDITLCKMTELVDAAKSKYITNPEIVTNDSKKKCCYGINCLNFSNGTCPLEHNHACYYGKNCQNSTKGLCPLEH